MRHNNVTDAKRALIARYNAMSIPTPWKKVLATHEEKQDLSTGPWLGDTFPGVALPDVKALHKWIILRLGDRYTCAQVMDVGPWTTDDDKYVFGTARPRAELGKGKFLPKKLSDPKTCPFPSNGAGIDLFPGTAKALGIPIGKNVDVEWRFVELV